MVKTEIMYQNIQVEIESMGRLKGREGDEIEN